MDHRLPDSARFHWILSGTVTVFPISTWHSTSAVASHFLPSLTQLSVALSYNQNITTVQFG